MKPIFLSIKFVCLIATCLVYQNACFAQSIKRATALESGLSYAEVLQQIGNAPKEKIEYETKRQELWIYQDGSLLFKDGLLVSWKRDNSPAIDVTDIAPPIAIAQHAGKQESDEMNAEMVQDILTEIVSAGSSTAPDSPPIMPPSNPGKNIPPPVNIAEMHRLPDE